MDRYHIALTRDGRKFGIIDRERYEYCALRDESGAVHPLEWISRASAQGWLQNCFRIWQAWEKNGEGEPPKRWRPHPAPIVSPFDRGMKFYD